MSSRPAKLLALPRPSEIRPPARSRWSTVPPWSGATRSCGVTRWFGASPLSGVTPSSGASPLSGVTQRTPATAWCGERVPSGAPARHCSQNRFRSKGTSSQQLRGNYELPGKRNVEKVCVLSGGGVVDRWRRLWQEAREDCKRPQPEESSCHGGRDCSVHYCTDGK